MVSILDYTTVNNFLYEVNENLSGYWTTMGFNNDRTEAYVTFIMDDEITEEIVTVKLSGKVICSEKLLNEMKAIG